MTSDKLDPKIVEILNDKSKSVKEHGEVLLNTPQMQQMLEAAKESELGRNPNKEQTI